MLRMVIKGRSIFKHCALSENNLVRNTAIWSLGWILLCHSLINIH